MKILIVNTSDIHGGAARAAYRLHRSLLDEGVESRMLVQSKSSNDLTVIGPKSKIQQAVGKIRFAMDSLPGRYYKNISKTLFSSGWVPFSRIVNRINEINPDVVHLHWIAGGMMPIEDLAKIKAPIVWSLHDMWPFTDGYHYDSAFDIQNYGLAEEPKVFIQPKNFKRKANTYRKLNRLTIIGLSKWLKDCSWQSKLLGDKPHINFPNPIDTSTFSPINKIQARAFFNLPVDKKIILFGALGAVSDRRKGSRELFEALEHVSADYELVIFGSNEPQNSQSLQQKANYLGYLNDDVSLHMLYCAADVMVVPSLQENLSNSIMESLACGIPVVGFNIGGNPDLIDHKLNGFLAKPFDTSDLAKGIEWVLNSDMYDHLCQNARKKVLREFENHVVALKYIKLYEKIINAN
jgi:glycosyltransferase involved in cell wall biosynthesis